MAKNLLEITVSTGGLTKIVKAKDPFDAVKRFIDQYHPTAMGLIASCVSDELDDTFYVSTERVLRSMGKWDETIQPK